MPAAFLCVCIRGLLQPEKNSNRKTTHRQGLTEAGLRERYLFGNCGQKAEGERERERII